MPKPVQLPTRESKPEKEPEFREGQIIKYITFFGDSAIAEDSEEYKIVYDTAKLLAKNGYAVVNGGGPGVMKAATDGAEAVNGYTVAVYWEPKMASIFEGKNMANVTDESQAYSNYMMRTLGLIEKGQVFVVCIGGTGTVSEFGMVWALAKLYFGKHKPVILLGKFWRALVDAFQHTMNIDEKELGVLNFAETKEDVLNLVNSFEAEMQMRTKRDYDGDESAFVVSSGVHRTKKSYDENAANYHRERAVSLVSQAQLEEFSKLVQPPAQVLDLGCGPGHDLSYLAERYTVRGIDNSKQMVEIARFENPNSDIEVGDVLTVELPDNFYKGIWARDVLHHISASDLDFVFKKLTKALVEQGILYIIVREGKGEQVEEEIRSGYTLHRFYHYFSEEELKAHAQKAGLELVSIDHTERSHKWLIGVFRRR